MSLFAKRGRGRKTLHSLALRLPLQRTKAIQCSMEARPALPLALAMNLLAAIHLLMLTPTMMTMVRRLLRTRLRPKLKPWTILRFGLMPWAAQLALTRLCVWSSCSRRMRFGQQRRRRCHRWLMSMRAGVMPWGYRLAASIDLECLVAAGALPMLVMLTQKQTAQAQTLAAMALLLTDLQASTQGEELLLQQRLVLVPAALLLDAAVGPEMPTLCICKYLGG